MGVLERGERDKDNETGLKEEGGIKMSTTVLPLRDARSFAFVFTWSNQMFRLKSFLNVVLLRVTVVNLGSTDFLLLLYVL